MRRTILSAILVLWCTSTIVLAQSTSPEALYDRGIDAITGVGPSENDALGIDYFRRSAELGFGPAQIALAYYYETGTGVARPSNCIAKLRNKGTRWRHGWLDGTTSSAMACRAILMRPRNGSSCLPTRTTLSAPITSAV
jgi:hypothetical protein